MWNPGREVLEVSERTKRAKAFVSHRQVFPYEANPQGSMFGGRIMEIMDSAAAIAADHFCDRNGSVIGRDRAESS